MAQISELPYGSSRLWQEPLPLLTVKFTNKFLGISPIGLKIRFHYNVLNEWFY